MNTSTTPPAPRGVDPEELDRHIAEMYRDVANEADRDEHLSFQRARIEKLPFDNTSFDALISNGVINLSADKRQVFAEAARLLRPGGRSHACGAYSVSLLALKPLAASRHTSDPYPGGGARVADATREEVFTNTTMTQEVSK